MTDDEVKDRILSLIELYEGKSMADSIESMFISSGFSRKTLERKLRSMIDSGYLEFDRNFNIHRGPKFTEPDYWDAVHQQEINRRTLVEEHGYVLASFVVDTEDFGPHDLLNVRVYIETDVSFKPKTPKYNDLREWLKGLFSASDGDLPTIDVIDFVGHTTGTDDDLHRLADRLYGEIIQAYPGRNVQIELTAPSSGVFKSYRPFLTPSLSR